MLVKKDGIIRLSASLDESFAEYDRRMALSIHQYLTDEVVGAEMGWMREEYAETMKESREIEANA